ncbi:MAG TPA: DNA translocase FtsK 4TM domain-containing protein [Candidatus Binatia bacterium]|nr:DNA translocase FtsK 4TM domain-containing protein [Candidatus Binatia bacterium]
MREMALWCAAGVALIVLVALFSYRPEDPGWSSSGDGGSVKNLVGPAGAWLADVLLSLSGYVAFVLPVMVFLLGLFLYRGRDGEDVLQIAPGWRALALLIAALSLMALSALHVGASPAWVPQGSGGIGGSLIGRGLVRLLNPVGATLMLLTILILALPLSLIFSWLQVLDRVGGATLSLAGMLRARHEATAAQRKSAPSAAPQARVQPQLGAAAPGEAAALLMPKEKEKEKKKRKMPAIAENQLLLPMGDGDKGGDVPPFKGDPLPPLSILDPPRPASRGYSPEDLERISREVEGHLNDFGVEAKVVAAQPGPVVTRFELQPAPGVKGAQVSNLAKDLARALSVSSVRVIEVIEGKSVIGLEIPNQKRDMVLLSEILAHASYSGSSSPITLALGKDIAGEPVAVDLGRMPHLMVAGTTGSGKSVAINAMILSMLYKATRDQVRFIFIDPKMLELSVYEGIPHLLTPVVTDMKDAANALRWCVAEMERRYRVMTALGVRNLAGLNRKIDEAAKAGKPLKDPLWAPPAPDLLDPEKPQAAEPAELRPMTNIVVVIDELADMMMVVGKKVEELIARLAQKARAAGVHLIVATQRPSVDVITGLIKANIPSRIAFQVASRVDSRTILDQMGAETLLGHGDMLYRPIGASSVQRLHGAFVGDEEVHKVVKYLKQVGEPEYIDDVLAGEPEPGEAGGEEDDAEKDPLYDQAVAMVVTERKASVSWVQRRLKIGYNRAARMVEKMEAAGLVGPSGPGGAREVLAPGR